MKSRIFKIAMSLAAVVFAIGGSFASHASVKKPHTYLTGYIDAFEACRISTACSDIIGPACTATIYVGSTAYTFQAWGKLQDYQGVCPLIIYQQP